MINGYLIALYVFIAYVLLLIVLWRSGLASRLKLGLLGPLVMVRTQRGITVLKHLSRARRFWRGFAVFSRIVFIAGMVGMLALLIWEAILVISVPRVSAPSLQSYLLLPGINPYVPLWYGLLGIIVAVVLHEMAHGVLSEAQDIDVQSMGVLLLVVPVGAFVEPDQKQLESVEPSKRVRVFGVGPGTNMILALLFFLLFIGPFLGAASPVHQGLTIVSIPGGSPAAREGLAQWDELLSVNGTPVTDASSLNSMQGLLPGHDYNGVVLHNGKEVNVHLVAGVVIVGIISGSPAASAGVRSGWIIAKMNGTTVMNEVQLSALFNSTVPNEKVPFVFVEGNGSVISMNITLSSVAAVEHTPSSTHPIGFLGVYLAYMGIEAIPMSSLLGLLRNPLYSATTPSSTFTSLLDFVVQPFEGLSPIPSGLAANLLAYGTTQSSLFWIGANISYWIFWINLWVGLFNMLPAIPLDGGYLFRDNLTLLLRRIMGKNSEGQRERIARSVTTFFSFLVFFLILWQFAAIRLI
ncbi:MAG: site-2 protease family protein [Methanomassiliicoccales archaeon]